MRRTRHQLREVAEGLTEDHVAVLRHAFLELLLQVSAPVLILAQIRNLSDKLLKASSCEAVD